MSRLRMALALSALLILLLVAYLWACWCPFTPTMLLRTSSFREVPEVNSPAFREALEYVLCDYSEPYIRIGPVILVKRDLATDSDMVYKHTRRALAISGQEKLFFGSDEEVMTEARMWSVMNELLRPPPEESEAENLEALFEWRGE